MKIKKFLLPILTIAIPVGIYLFWFYRAEITPEFGGSHTQSAAVTESEVDNNNYTHSRLKFSFAKPDGYKVVESNDGGKQLVLLESNASAKRGVQILMTRAGVEELELTRAIIVSNIPDMQITNDKKVPIDGVKGIFFESDNPAFSGKSIEAWFVHKGTLYQISGYSEGRVVIEEVLSTWEFKT